MSKRSNPYSGFVKRQPKRRDPRGYTGLKPLSKPRAGKSSVARTRGAEVQGEMKMLSMVAAGNLVSDASWISTSVDPAPTNCLFAPVTGSAVYERDGREVEVHYIKVKGHIKTNATGANSAADAALSIRLALVIDHETNGAQANGAAVFDAHASIDHSMNSFQSLNNFGRFTVCKDKTFVFPQPTATWDGVLVGTTLRYGMIKPFKMTKRFNPPLKVRYNSTNGGTVADIVNHSFHLYANALNTDQAPSLYYDVRTGFKG
jgi:hypothetical protein